MSRQLILPLLILLSYSCDQGVQQDPYPKFDLTGIDFTHPDMEPVLAIDWTTFKPVGTYRDHDGTQGYDIRIKADSTFEIEFFGCISHWKEKGRWTNDEEILILESDSITQIRPFVITDDSLKEKINKDSFFTFTIPDQEPFTKATNNISLFKYERGTLVALDKNGNPLDLVFK